MLRKSSIAKIALVLCIYERREMMLKELNDVIDYIEEHLTDDNLSLKQISKYAEFLTITLEKYSFIYQD